MSRSKTYRTIYPLEYRRFERKTIGNEEIICLYWRFGPNYKMERDPIEDSSWCFHGKVIEDQIKNKLNDQQFKLFENGDNGPFISDKKISKEYFKQFG